MLRIMLKARKRLASTSDLAAHFMISRLLQHHYALLFFRLSFMIHLRPFCRAAASLFLKVYYIKSAMLMLTRFADRQIDAFAM